MKTPARLLSATLTLVIVFVLSFFFFYKRAESQLPKTPLILTSAVINQPLPNASLVDVNGKQLADERLRKGKVVLVFTLTECKPCDDENEFLKSVVGNRKDISFFDVIPFGKKEEVLKRAQSKYAFEVFFDDHSMLSRSLQIYQVPIKIFVEDGVIRKTWLDSTVDDAGKAAFKEWLDNQVGHN